MLIEVSPYQKSTGNKMTDKTAIQKYRVTRNIISESAQMQAIFRHVKRVAPTKATVLITGETGVGKEIVAQAIHESSPRRGAPFKIINCGAIPKELIQSELFGHEKGAFTTAIRQHRGIFEQANRGTLFLDEVTEMPLDAQANLLRVLERHEFSRVGGEEIFKVDVRIIAATNVNLKTAVNEKRFREDLYYRLNLFRIQIPPLRNRRSDIGPLALNFVSQFSEEYSKSITSITPEAINYLQNVDWYGNVRELRNVIETAIILTDGEKLKKEDVQMVVENLNERDENSAELSDAIRVEAETSKEFNGDSHITSENKKNRLWELVQAGTMSEITAYTALMRYQAESSHHSKQDIAKTLKISVPTLDKYCALAKETFKKDS